MEGSPAYISRAHDATRLRINLSSMAARSIAIPPMGEQRRIVDSVASEVLPLDTAMSRLGSEVELLREYRARLVTDIVTGQLDVRAAAQSLPDVEVSDEAAEVTDLVAVDETDDEGEAA